MGLYCLYSLFGILGYCSWHFGVGICYNHRDFKQLRRDNTEVTTAGAAEVYSGNAIQAGPASMMRQLYPCSGILPEELMSPEIVEAIPLRRASATVLKWLLWSVQTKCAKWFSG